MVTINKILEENNVVKFVGDKTVNLSEMGEIKNYVNKNTVLYWVNDKNLYQLNNLEVGTFICSENIPQEYLKPNCNYIIVQNPRSFFKIILEKYFYKKAELNFISHTASIHQTANISKDVYIGNNVVIEENCSIGKNTFIGHNTVILRNTKIGNNVVIGSNNTIGGIGFGYEKDEEGKFKLIPHIGNVVIKDNVDIGNNTCIDRGVLGSTIIEENCKIDNLVHIAHGVQLGKNSMVIANSMVAGSVVTGENVWIAPSANILNGIEIGANSLIGMGAIVTKSVPSDQVWAGSPAKPLDQLKAQLKKIDNL